jgi:two-component system, sensor histidine kinase RegB
MAVPMNNLKRHSATREFTPERVTRLRPMIQPALDWILKLRWTAFIAQFLTIILSVYIIKIRLPMGELLGVIALGAISNGVLYWMVRKAFFSGNRVIGIALILDSLLLTVLLGLSGAAGNPFTSFYILHVTLAALTLGLGWSMVILVICLACFGLLFAWDSFFGRFLLPVVVPHELHLAGMLVSFVLMGAALGYFVSQVSRALREREKQLAESQFLATQNERFAALASLAGGVAHELATPLGTIAVISKEIWSEASRSNDSSSLAEDAALLRQEVERCREILQRMSDQFTSGMGESPQIFYVRDALREVEIKCRRTSGSRLILDEFEDRTIFCARRSLIESLVALVRNAMDASSPERPVHIRTSFKDDMTCFQVEDHGAGISTEDLHRIGEPFYSTKSPGRGMGLGLFLVRTFIHRIGGSLRFSSEPGTGTLVDLEIPIHPELEEQT